MNVGRGLWNITSITVCAIFGIVVMKLIFAKYYVPGLSDVVAMV